MSHGITDMSSDRALTRDYFAGQMQIVSEMGFSTIGYDQLAAWRGGGGELPDRPIMIDFDHPQRCMRHEVFDVLQGHGFKANLFVDTGRMANGEPGVMTWDEIAELLGAGWNIGAHTVSHPNLSQLSEEDPTGEKIRMELEQCDATIHEHLGVWPKDFAYTGTSLSTAAIREVAKRYRFGRLWIIGSEYEMDGRTVQFADLVGVEGDPELDGGPPMAVRYITRQTDPYMLPSMDLQYLIYDEEPFRNYLAGAIDPA